MFVPTPAHMRVGSFKALERLRIVKDSLVPNSTLLSLLASGQYSRKIERNLLLVERWFLIAPKGFLATSSE